MYSYIIGKVVELNINYIVLDNNGIGYKIFVSNIYNYEVGNDYKVYLYNHIREEEHSLYGFKKKEEYDLFIKLLSVKGVGPKMGLLFFSIGEIDNIIKAINNEDTTYLKKIPKVGDKLANQIILDLKGKLDISLGITKKEDEVYLALISLGFKSVDILKVLTNVNRSKENNEQIKEALALLMK